MKKNPQKAKLTQSEEKIPQRAKKPAEALAAAGQAPGALGWPPVHDAVLKGKKATGCQCGVRRRHIA